MKTSNKAGMAIVCASTLAFSSFSFAAETGFTASAAISHTSDDNVFRDAANTSDTIFTVSPDLLFTKAFGKHQLSAGYKGAYATYDKNTKENFDDHTVNLDLLLDLSTKFKVDLKSEFAKAHESRGTSASAAANTADEVTMLDKNTLFAGFTIGRDSSKAQVELDYSVIDTKYTNNSQSTRDRKDNTASARVFYNVSDKTRLFAEAQQNNFDYINSNSDSTEILYHLGLRWDIAGKTTGELKVGTFDKKFDSSAFADEDGTSYLASVLWSPMSYSNFTFSLSSAPQEATTGDSFYTASYASVNWLHDFNSKFALAVDYSDGTDDYSGTRKDKIKSAGLGMNYKFRNWLDLGLKYTNSKRDSSAANSDYTDNLVMFTATLLHGDK